MNKLLLVANLSSTLLNTNNLNLFKSDEYFFENEELVVLGNLDNINYDEYLSKNKEVLIYDVKDRILNGYSFVYKNPNFSDKVYFYKSSTAEKDKELSEISTYYNSLQKDFANINVPKRATASSYNDNLKVFSRFRSYSIRENKAPYGYFDYDIGVYILELNNTSSLYFIKLNHSFVCGQMAKKIGGTNYENYIHRGYNQISLRVFQREFEYNYDDIFYGGIPVFQDYYPVSQPKEVTITSSYTSGLTIGFSSMLGFSLSEGLSKSLGLNLGGSFALTYSKSYTTTNPYLVSQKGNKDNEVVWRYEYVYNTDETNNQEVGYFFEMNNYQNKQDVKYLFGFEISSEMSLYKRFFNYKTINARNLFLW